MQTVSNPTKERFAVITDEFIEKISNSKVSRNSRAAENTWCRVFDSWGAAQAPPRKAFKEYTIEELVKDLPTFILAVRTQKGKLYSPHSYPVMLAALFRLRNRLDGTELNFFKDPQFKPVLRILDSYIHQLQTEGHVGVSKALPLTIPLRKALFDHEMFSADTPAGLVRRAYLCMGELGERISWYRALTLGRVQVTMSDEPDIDIINVVGIPDKNHPGGIAALGSEKNWGKTLYDNVSNPEYSAVAVIKKYIAHLPQDLDMDSPFFLSPLKQPKGDVWFSKAAVGINAMGMLLCSSFFVSFLMQLSGKWIAEGAAACGFEGKYTNHSMRRELVTELAARGVDEQTIMSFSGHLSTAGVREYREILPAHKRKVAEMLHIPVEEKGNEEEDPLPPQPKKARMEPPKPKGVMRYKGAPEGYIPEHPILQPNDYSTYERHATEAAVFDVMWAACVDLTEEEEEAPRPRQKSPLSSLMRLFRPVGVTTIKICAIM